MERLYANKVALIWQEELLTTFPTPLFEAHTSATEKNTTFARKFGALIPVALVTRPIDCNSGLGGMRSHFF